MSIVSKNKALFDFRICLAVCSFPCFQSAFIMTNMMENGQLKDVR